MKALLQLQHGVHCPHQRRGDESGFTLVELIIVTAITPLIVGALSLALISVFSLQNGVSGRLTDSAYAQTLSSVYFKDVQSAAIVNTGSTVQCQSPSGGAQTQLLGLAWNGSGTSPSGFQTSVSYVTAKVGTSYALIRQLCTGSSTTASSTNIIANNIDVTKTVAPMVLCASATSTSCAPDPSTSWTSASGVAQISLQVSNVQNAGTGSGKAFQYTLQAVPRLFTENTPPPLPITPFAPLTLLGSTSSCDQASPTIPGSGNGSFSLVGDSVNSNVSITVNGQTAPMEVNSSCPNSVVFGNNAVVNVATILSQNAANAVSGPKNCSTACPSSGYSPPVVDPFTGLPAPIKSALSAGSCSTPDSNKVSNCTPGLYLVDPGTADATKNAQTFHFASGVYYFGAGLTLSVNADNPDNGGVLFYTPNGQQTSIIGGTVTLPALPGYDGITIWDAATSNYANSFANPFAVSNTVTFVGGGIYVPNGGMQQVGSQANTGSFTTSFVVAQWVSLPNNFTLIISSP